MIFSLANANKSKAYGVRSRLLGACLLSSWACLTPSVHAADSEAGQRFVVFEGQGNYQVRLTGNSAFPVNEHQVRINEYGEPLGGMKYNFQSSTAQLNAQDGKIVKAYLTWIARRDMSPPWVLPAEDDSQKESPWRDQKIRIKIDGGAFATYEADTSYRDVKPSLGTVYWSHLDITDLLTAANAQAGVHDISVANILVSEESPASFGSWSITYVVESANAPLNYVLLTDGYGAVEVGSEAEKLYNIDLGSLGSIPANLSVAGSLADWESSVSSLPKLIIFAANTGNNPVKVTLDDKGKVVESEQVAYKGNEVYFNGVQISDNSSARSASRFLGGTIDPDDVRVDANKPSVATLPGNGDTLPSDYLSIPLYHMVGESALSGATVGVNFKPAETVSDYYISTVGVQIPVSGG